jgi:hypothetical protein
MIQTSPVHVGRSEHPERALEDLLTEFVRLPTARRMPPQAARAEVLSSTASKPTIESAD